ncbi:hypothetical protein [Heyndrickxia acidiproducens]|uniref:hypothetical protein n=1 Tax=Heyndrickxia acidiproducens TaxID=1121084 RepID=UPI00036F79F2|nr:hypothetical protein [Heyndrickxia acidiproducens]
MERVETLFDELKKLLNELNGRKLPNSMKLTITYVTGEQDIFNASIATWSSIMLAAKERKKYFYINNNLINMEHVIKYRFEDIENSVSTT